ncbi:MAG: hypothetical protein F4Y42_05200, partial [Caldilineaceae bacterium SB0664_bin_27]|nr:hypothetical protein [Caldilineaceae bacterium SB0664_bin_27]
MGPQKQCIFPKSDALLDIGVLTREKKGEKRCESSASLGMHHFVQKIGSNAAAREAPRARVFELIPAAKSERKRGCLWSVMYSFCTGSAGALGTRSAWDRKGLGQAWLADDAYEIHKKMASVHPGILT